MLELKVQCDCGQKIKFDVEPVNNRMPFTLICPICGADGTEKANALLQSAPSAFPPAPAPSTSYGVPPSAPLVPAVPVGTEKPRLRINIGGSHAATPASSADKEQETSPVDAAIAATGGGTPSRFPSGATAARPAKVYKDPEALNLPMGILGAVIGGFLGMAGWFLLIKWTHSELGYAAWGVGLLTGLGARILGRGGDSSLGLIAAICALVAILGGRFWFVSDLLGGMSTRLVETIGDDDYERQMELGKEALNARTDDEIRAIYKKINDEDATAGELAEFKTKEFRVIKDIASGKITKAQYIADQKKEGEASMPKFGFKERWAFFKLSLTLDPLIYLFVGLGAVSAYKIGAG